MTEEAIHKAVIQNLNLRGLPHVFWFHVPNGGKRSWSEGKTFKALGVIAGVPDLILLRDGKTYALELKSPTGRLSPSQRLVLTHMAQCGAETAVANSLDEALVTLECWGILRRSVNSTAFPKQLEEARGD